MAEDKPIPGRKAFAKEKILGMELDRPSAIPGERRASKRGGKEEGVTEAGAGLHLRADFAD
jgi:hypothetical protein